MPNNNACKFRLYPDEEQKALLARNFGSCRYVYNYLLNQWKMCCSALHRAPMLSEMCRTIKVLKRQQPAVWLKEADSTALQAEAQFLKAAFDNFFDGRSGYPRFKSRRSGQRMKIRNGNGRLRIGHGCIRIPKIGWIKAALSREICGRILSVCISLDSAGRCWASVQTADEEFEQFAATGRAVGIDLGLKDVAILSDGAVYENPRHLKKRLAKIRHLQKILSRKPKGSRQWQRVRRKLAGEQAKVADSRRDAQHKMTTEIVRRNDIICVGDLAVKNLVRNHCLAQAIHDAGWGEIRRQLAYKAERHGRSLVVVGRFYASSQTCHACGYKHTAVKDLKVREWDCPVCGAHHDRDINAAVNIRQEGLRILAQR